MTLKTITENIAESIPINAPSIIVGNSDQTAKTLLAQANKAGKSLARRIGRFPFIELIKEHTFSTVDGTASYSLPDDFAFLVDDTLWDRTNFWDLRGPLSPQNWQVYKSSVLSDSNATNKRFRIKVDSGTLKFFIDPTPGSADDLVFEYVSKNWCQDLNGVGQSAWEADDDTGVLDEYLIELDATWRVLNRLGMAYLEEKNEAEREIQKALARQGGAPILSTNNRIGRRLISSANVPDTGFGQ